MPLDKAHITAASQRMLPSYPVFFGVVGAGLLLTPLHRLTQTPSFNYANSLFSIRWWGAGFLALAIAFIGALIAHRRKPYQIALGVAIAWMTLWSIVTATAALVDLSSFTAWVWPAFIARACWASLVSLETRET